MNDKEELLNRIAELEDALRPFALRYTAWDDKSDDTPLSLFIPSGPDPRLRVGDLHRAHSLLKDLL